jgi:threonyl-tRNA synthetase
MAQISLTLPDGARRSYDAGITPAEVAADISPSLAKKAISATVNGAHWDLAMAGRGRCRDRHSHHEGRGAGAGTDPPRPRPCHGPRGAGDLARGARHHRPRHRNGWYYDFDREEPFTPEDLGQIEAKMREIINRRDPVTTEIWDRDRAVKYYEANNEPYKVELVGMIPEGQPIRMYWHGHWQDLCRGPHLQHTGQLPADAFKLMSVAGAYWRGDSNRPMLQRIYGVGSATATTSRPT